MALGFVPSDRAQAGLEVEMRYWARAARHIGHRTFVDPAGCGCARKGGRMPYRDRPIDHPSVWSGARCGNGAWIYHLSAAEIAELDDAVAASAALPVTEITRADAPLPTLGRA